MSRPALMFVQNSRNGKQRQAVSLTAGYRQRPNQDRARKISPHSSPTENLTWFTGIPDVTSPKAANASLTNQLGSASRIYCAQPRRGLANYTLLRTYYPAIEPERERDLKKINFPALHSASLGQWRLVLQLVASNLWMKIELPSGPPS